MTQTELKGMTSLGAELGAAKAENEKLRGLLREIRPTMPRDVLELWCRDRDAALSQQAEPVEPAPAQDELLPCPFCGGEPYFTHDHYVHDDLSPMPCVECRKCSAHLKAQDWNCRVTRPAQTEQQPSTTQQVLDLILEQCRYWHGRDEARRGGFACLYAQAKDIADNAAPVAQPAQTELVEALRTEFPLFDDDGLDEKKHHCEWATQQDRKRLHKMLAALAAKGGRDE